MKPASVLTLALLSASASCHRAPASQASPAKPATATVVAIPGNAPPNGQRDVFIRASDSFSPQHGEAAMRAFVPEVAVEDSGGECTVNRTAGSGATIVTAFYPLRTSSRFQITVTFDSVGHVVRYSERRGVPHIKPPPNATRMQVDSAIRAAEAAIRSTTISLDYPIDQAIVMNRGGGKPTDAVLATIRDVEHAETLGSVSARLEKMRKLCGM